MNEQIRERIEKLARETGLKAVVATRQDLIEVLTIALTAFAEEEQKPIVPAMYEDDIRELIERLLDDTCLTSRQRDAITRHSLNIMQENKKNFEARDNEPGE